MAVRLLPALVLAALAATSAAPDRITYTFDGVRASYGLSFTADPPPDGNATWMTDLAGGPGQPLQVTYGQVEFLRDGEWHPGELILRFSGPGGSKAYLVNSCARTQHADGATTTKGEYSWHKRVENSSIVKDWSPPASAVYLVRELDANGGLTGMRFRPFAHAGADGHQGEMSSFWLDPPPTAGMWTVRMDSLVEAGVRPTWTEVC